MESQRSKRQLQNKKNSNPSNCSTHPSPSPSSHSTKRILKQHSGSLEIIEGDATNLYSPDCEDSENESRPASQGFYRPWSRSSVGSVPPRPDSSQSRRLVTPSKQISLQTVKRKEESSEPFAPDVDLAALSLDKSYNRAWDFTSFNEEEHSCVSTPKFDSGSDLYAPQHATQLRLPRPHENSEAAVEHMNSIHEDGAIGGAIAALPLSQADSRENLQQAEEKVANNTAARLAHDDNEEEEDDDEDDSSEEEERKAPNELLIEFVECLMKKDYENAQKLCKMILLYEPTNPEALKFQPVIEEKLRLDAEAEEADSNEDDDNEEDEEDDEDGDDSSSNEDEDSDDSDDDDDDDDEDEEEDSIFRAMAEAVSANYYASREDPATASGSGS